MGECCWWRAFAKKWSYLLPPRLRFCFGSPKLRGDFYLRISLFCFHVSSLWHTRDISDVGVVVALLNQGKAANPSVPIIPRFLIARTLARFPWAVESQLCISGIEVIITTNRRKKIEILSREKYSCDTQTGYNSSHPGWRSDKSRCSHYD